MCNSLDNNKCYSIQKQTNKIFQERNILIDVKMCLLPPELHHNASWIGKVDICFLHMNEASTEPNPMM